MQQAPLEEVVVTGSRIVRQDLVANSPIQTVDSEFFENSSTVAIETMLNQLPQFVPAITQFDTGNVQPSATNTTGANTISLRGLGSNRNLVLFDGRRAQPVNSLLVVDTNSIPSAAIERVEVVTGGASATYGADAIAGVVNFVMKKNFEGLSVDLQTGGTEKGDGAETRVSTLLGANVADGRGNVMVGLEYADREIVYRNGHDFFDAQLTDPSAPATNTTFLTPTQYGADREQSSGHRHHPEHFHGRSRGGTGQRKRAVLLRQSIEPATVDQRSDGHGRNLYGMGHLPLRGRFPRDGGMGRGAPAAQSHTERRPGKRHDLGEPAVRPALHAIDAALDFRPRPLRGVRRSRGLRSG